MPSYFYFQSDVIAFLKKSLMSRFLRIWTESSLHFDINFNTNFNVNYYSIFLFNIITISILI